MKVHKVLRLHHAQHFPNCGASQLFPHGDKLRLRIQTKQRVKPSVMLGHDVTKLAGNYREPSAITKYASSNKRRLSAKNLDTNVSKEKKEHPVQCFRKKNPDVCHMGKQSAAAIFKQSDECGVTRRANHIQVRVYCLLIQYDGFSCKEILACTHTQARTNTKTCKMKV